MPIASGTRLGFYEILNLLGSGGMGHVYRALDTRNDREVALKTLESELPGGAERLARFEREAQTLQRLDHPNLPHILDWQGEGRPPYLVMELLDGETLRQRLDRAPLPFPEALGYARQLAEGLAEAHGHGIVHRDLKPSNIFLTSEGRVKIMDFGLAKAMTAPIEDQTSISCAPSEPETRVGAVMGTVGYMSPEQVRGIPVDHRADLFTLGILFHEMFLGQRAFDAPSSVEMLNAILKEDPPGLRKDSPLSPQVKRILQGCLAKRPQDRYASAREVAAALAQLSPTRAMKSRFSPFWMAWVPLTLVVGAACLGMGWNWGNRPPPNLQRLTFRQGLIRSARFTAVGDEIFYSAAWGGAPVQVFSTRPESPESRALALPEAELLDLSPSGDMALSLGSRPVQSWVWRGTLARASITGGAPRELMDQVMAADWSPDGQSLAVVRVSEGRVRLEYPMGNTLVESPGWISHPRISPDGRRVAYLSHPVAGDDAGRVEIVDAQRVIKPLGRNWASVQGLAWNRDEVWFTAAEKGVARAIWAANARGDLRKILQVPGPLTLHDISKDGRGVLVTREVMHTGILGKGPGDGVERELSWLDWSLAQDLSDDGKSLLINEQGEGASHRYGIYLRNTDGSPATQLGEGAYPVLSPDGRWTASVVQGTPPQIQILPTAAGESHLRPVPELGTIHRLRWFPDGHRLMLQANVSGQPTRIYQFQIADGKLKPLIASGTQIFGMPINPEATMVVARKDDQTDFLWPLDGGPPKPIAGLKEGERVIRWAADGRSLFVMNLRQVPCVLVRLDLQTGKRTNMLTLTPDDPAGLTVSNFLITPSGHAYVYAYRRVLSELYLYQGLR